MKQLIIIIIIFMAACLFSETVLDEDFESGSIPTNWTQEFVDGNESWTVSNGGYAGHPESANSGFYNARFFVEDTEGNTTKLITPQFNLGINDVGTLTFYHTQQNWVGYQDELKIYYKNSPDGQWNLITSITINLPNWTMRQISLPNPSTTYWIAFEGFAEYGYGVCLDDVHVDGEPMYNSDLQGIALSGPGNVTAGNSEPFAITVFNAGIEPQSDYYLKLYKPGGIEIASTLITEEIPVGNTENHFIVWNIQESEPDAYYDIYGSVELASDENIYNNETPPLTVHISPPGTQYLVEEGFEGGEIPPGWTQEFVVGTEEWTVQTGGASSNPPAAHTGTYNAAFTHVSSGNKTRLVTPEINLGTANPGTLNFWHTQALWYSDQDELRIYYKNAPTADWILIQEYTESFTEWTEETITLPNPSPNYLVAFEALDDFGYGVCLDDVVIIGNPTVFDNDLAAMDIDGATITNAGNSELFEVQIKNVGDLPQSDYTVNLMKIGNNVVASQTVSETLQPGEIAIHNLIWNIPTNEPAGLAQIWANVELEGDENIGNNSTAPISIQIFPQGILEVIVGDGTETNTRLPLCFEHLNSLTESIYFPNELNNLTGHINAITYYNNFTSTIQSTPTKVWMGETNLTSLIDGWILPTQLNLVFDGAVTYPAGENSVTIYLDSQYYYSGQNLVVMVQRPMDTQSYASTDYFYLTETASIMDRTRYERDNVIEIDPYDPVPGYTFEKFPNTKFTFYQGEMGDVQGYVRDNEGNPLPNAEIQILENAQIAYTDDNGFFQIGNVLTGSYQFQASSYGYNPQIIIDEIVYEETLELEFELEPLGVVNVTGTVVGSDYPEQGLEGATVNITGFGTYETLTDANGYFSIPGVYTNQLYNIAFNHEDYESYAVDFQVAGVDYDLGNIILNEFTSPPTNVNGVQNGEGTIVDLSWNGPGFGGSEFRYDDGDPVGLIGFTETYPNAAFGVVFPNNAVLEEVSWQLSDQYGSHSMVKIIILGLGAESTPDNQEILYQSLQIPNVDNQWNSITLPELVAAPNGFFVGLIVPGSYAGIALDDGVDAPWEYIAGRQLASTDWTSSIAAWQQIGDFGLPQNMLIRSFGLNYGERTQRTAETMPFSEISTATRSFEHYKIYRFVDIYQTLPQYWTEVASGIIDTTFSDVSWSSLDPGFYQYGVKSVHTNDVESNASFSNVIQKTTPAGSENEEVPAYNNALLGNIPNPFNPITEIFFTVAADNSPVIIDIYNAKGQKIRKLVNDQFNIGKHSAIWNGKDDANSAVGSGIYFFKMTTADNEIETRKMLLLK